MLRFACPKLKDLATTMREKYDVRNKMILRNSSDADMLKVEDELIHIHRTMARHRRTCGQCKSHENLARMAPSSVRHLPPEKPFLSFDIAS
jgi:hypothetical protein